VINFRYHIVSLMAVFLALSVGIAVGVTLRPSVDVGLAQQAAQDRQQVQDLRVELDQRNRLADYRDDWTTRITPGVIAGALAGDRVALVTMPDAPQPVVDAVAAAVAEAGGTVTSTAAIDNAVFDPAQEEETRQRLRPVAAQLGVPDSATLATQLGSAVGRALLASEAKDRDAVASSLVRGLGGSGLVNIDDDDAVRAQLAIVVAGEAPDSPRAAAETAAHVELQLALKTVARGVVVAGPNSGEIEDTDVLTIRRNPAAPDALSTVDVADLPSGVVTVMLAGQEQLLGRGGHYGALAGADAPLPELPVR